MPCWDHKKKTAERLSFFVVPLGPPILLGALPTKTPAAQGAGRSDAAFFGPEGIPRKAFLCTHSGGYCAKVTSSGEAP